MADFGTILNPDNKSLTLFTKSVDVDDNFYIKGVPINNDALVKAYACPTLISSDVPASSTILMRFRNPLPLAVSNINVNDTIITITKDGDYSFQLGIFIIIVFPPYTASNIVFTILVNGEQPNNNSLVEFSTINGSPAKVYGEIKNIFSLKNGDVITVSCRAGNDNAVRINNGSLLINKL